MSKSFAVILAIVLVLAAEESLAYWWMHPAPAGLGQPVLCYRPNPSRSAGVPPASSFHDPQAASSTDNSSTDHRSLTTDHSSSPLLSETSRRAEAVAPYRSLISDHSSSYTSLPEVVSKCQPSLRCTTGTAARLDLDDNTTIHLAFFEWDLADSTNVLEAYKHLPDECMGSIGMTLIEHRPPRAYQIGGETLTFDHTIFRDPRNAIVHAFKGTWVSGASSLLGNGVRGGAVQARQLRWRAGLNRFHPAYARVAQGAVRGTQNPDQAWQAFQDAMLVDLNFESVGRGGLAAP